MINGNSLTSFAIGSTIVGIGFILGFTAVIMSVGMVVPPVATTFAISIIMAFMSIGGFISGFFFAFIQSIFKITYMRFPFILGAICMTIYAIIHTLLNLKATKTQGHSVQGGSSGVE